MPNTDHIKHNGQILRDIAMTYPGAHEDFPWGETAIKVRGKAFLFMHMGAEQLSLSCKLPASHEMALMLPFAKPTGYGLGKSGWVTAAFGPHDEPPIDLLREWLDESYRAIAPKRLLKAEPGGVGTENMAKKTSKATSAKKTASKTTASATTASAKKTAAAKKTVSKTGAKKSAGAASGAKETASAAKPAKVGKHRG